MRSGTVHPFSINTLDNLPVYCRAKGIPVKCNSIFLIKSQSELTSWHHVRLVHLIHFIRQPTYGRTQHLNERVYSWPCCRWLRCSPLSESRLLLWRQEWDRKKALDLKKKKRLLLVLITPYLTFLNDKRNLKVASMISVMMERTWSGAKKSKHKHLIVKANKRDKSRLLQSQSLEFLSSVF